MISLINSVRAFINLLNRYFVYDSNLGLRELLSTRALKVSRMRSGRTWNSVAKQKVRFDLKIINAINLFCI